MIGQGINPVTWSPLAEALSPDQLAGFLVDIRDRHAATARALPTHADTVARHCMAKRQDAAPARCIVTLNQH